MAKKWNFGNGRLICMTQNAQGCLGGIMILDQRPLEKQELQKTEYGLQNKLQPSKTSFYCRTMAKKTP